MKREYNVEGMSCSACSSAVERVVKRINGVSKANVNLVAKLLQCEFDEKLVTDADVIKAVEKAGFTATVIENKKTEKKEKVSNSNLPSVKFRLIFSIILLLPLLYLSMSGMLGLPLPDFLSKQAHPLTFALLQMSLASPVLYVNRKFFYSGVKALLHRSPNMDTLVMMGSGIAYLFSVFSIIMIGVGFENGDTDKIARYVNSLYFESSAMILTLITIGKLLEEKAKNKTGSAVEELKKLTPDTVTVLDNGKPIQIKTSELKLGDLVVVKNGEGIPVDGEIVEGGGYIDQSAINGESLPIYKSVGDKVISASINTDGYIVVKATAVGDDTTLSKIIDLVRDAGVSKAPIAKLADKISGIFVPIVMGIALVTLIVWLSLGYAFEIALVHAVSVLVISCPCALGLATPVAVSASIGLSAKKGILIKSAGALQQLSKTDIVVFDKTGTLTIGKPTVKNMVTFNGVKEDELKKIARALEDKNSHPLAKAVVDYCGDVGFFEASDYTVINGKGVECVVDGVKYLTGNEKFFVEKGIDISVATASANKMYNDGHTVLWFARQEKVIGLMSVSDTIKDNAKETVKDLKEQGISVNMLSGDNRFSCQSVCNALDIDFAYSEVMPDEKEKTVATIMSENKTVVFVGDGINDSPALTRADIGMALDNGTAIAIDSADVVLLNGDIKKVTTCIKIGKKTMRVIKQNLFWAFFYNIILIPIATGVFSFLGINISPMLGALAMSVSSLFVVTNALRLLK